MKNVQRKKSVSQLIHRLTHSVKDRWRQLHVELCEDRVLLSASPASLDDSDVTTALVSSFLNDTSLDVTIPDLGGEDGANPQFVQDTNSLVSLQATSANVTLSSGMEWVQDSQGVYCATIGLGTSLNNAFIDANANKEANFYVTLASNVTIGSATTANLEARTGTFTIDGVGAYHLTNQRASLEINDCTFINCASTGTNTGGAITNGAGTTATETLTLKRCHFQNCHASASTPATLSDGGAVYNKGTLNVEDCTFAFCGSNHNGAAIQSWCQSKATSVTLSGNNHFFNCSTGITSNSGNVANGAVVHIGTNATLTWTGTADFHNCTSTYGYSVLRLPASSDAVNCNVTVNTYECGDLAKVTSHSPAGVTFSVNEGPQVSLSVFADDFLVVGTGDHCLTMAEAIHYLGTTNPNDSTKTYNKIYFADNSDVFYLNSDVTLAQDTVLDASQTVTFSGSVWSRQTVDTSRKVTINGTNSFHFIVNEGVNLTATNISFERCKSTTNGGAIQSNGTLTLNSCEFHHCTSTLEGGAIWAGSNSGVILNGTTTFAECTTDAHGGAISIAVSGTLTTATDSVTNFINCSTKMRGGAIDNYGTISINNATFTDCQVNANNNGTIGGGAIFNESGALLTLGEVSFTGCTATNDLGEKTSKGGAIYSEGEVRLTDNATFTDCTAKNDGGAIYVDGANGKLTQTATNAGNIANVLNCTDCSANRGGALYFGTGSSAVLSGAATFTECTATADGGAICNNCGDSSLVEFDGTMKFDRCSANKGGGFCQGNGNSLFNHSTTFTDCTATTSGGGMELSSDKSQATFNQHTTIKNCTAGTGGAFNVANASGKVIFKDDVSLELCKATAENEMNFFATKSGNIVSSDSMPVTITISTDIRRMTDYTTNGYDSQYITIRYDESNIKGLTGDFLVVDSIEGGVSGSMGITLETAMGYLGETNVHATDEGVYFQKIYFAGNLFTSSFDGKLLAEIAVTDTVLVRNNSSRTGLVFVIDANQVVTKNDNNWIVSGTTNRNVQITLAGKRVMKVDKDTTAVLNGLILQNYETGGTEASGGGLTVHGNAIIQNVTVQNSKVGGTDDGGGVYIASIGSLQVKGELILQNCTAEDIGKFFCNAGDSSHIYDEADLGIIRINTPLRDANDYNTAGFNKEYGVTLIYQEDSDAGQWAKLTSSYIIVTTSDDVVANDEKISLREAIHYLGISNELAGNSGARFTHIYFADTVTNQTVQLANDLVMYNDSWREDENTLYGIINGGTIYKDNGGTWGVKTTGTTVTIDSNAHTMEVAGYSGIGYDNINIKDTTQSTTTRTFCVQEHGELFLGDVDIERYASETLENVVDQGGAIYCAGYLVTGWNGGTTAIHSERSVGNKTAKRGGAIYVTTSGAYDVEGTTTITNTGAHNSGGGLHNCGITQIYGTLTISDCEGAISKSESPLITSGGGAVYNSGILSIMDETSGSGTMRLTDNTSYLHGGGIFNAVNGVFEVVENAETASVAKIEVTGNKAYRLGGGILNNGNMTLSNAKVNGNSVDPPSTDNNQDRFGGGICNMMSGILHFSKGLICQNAANDTNASGNFRGTAGGVFNQGTMYLSDVIISENTAFGHGGGVYNSGNAYLSGDVYILENTAGGRAGGLYSTTLVSQSYNVNTSVHAATIMTDGTAGDRNRLYICGNTANESGGGLYNATNYYESRDAEQYFQTGDYCDVNIGSLSITQEVIDSISAVIPNAGEYLTVSEIGGNKVTGDGYTNEGWGGGYYAENVWYIGNYSTINIYDNFSYRAGGGIYLDARSGFEYTALGKDGGEIIELDFNVTGNRTGFALTTKTDNARGFGGGIYNAAHDVRLINFNIDNNWAGVAGGGLYNCGNLIFTDTTSYVEGGVHNAMASISGNVAESLMYHGGTMHTFGGGGVYNCGVILFSGHVDIIGNEAKGGYGGGVYNSPYRPHTLATAPNSDEANMSIGTDSDVHIAGNIASEKRIGTATTLYGGYGGGIYTSINTGNLDLQNLFYVSGRLTLEDNAARRGGGLYLNGYFNMDFASKINNIVTFDGNNRTVAQMEAVAYDDTNLTNYGGALFIGSSNKMRFGGTDSIFQMRDASHLVFKDNGTYDDGTNTFYTYGGAIYNGTNTISFKNDMYEFLDTNYGIQGAFIYSEGAVIMLAANVPTYYAGQASADGNVTRETYKLFSNMIANQKGGSAIALNTAAGSQTGVDTDAGKSLESILENVRIYNNDGDGILLMSGVLTIDKASEIGSDCNLKYMEYYDTATSAYKTEYHDFDKGNTGSGIKVTGGVLSIEVADDVSRARYHNVDSTLMDYQVLQATIISKNEEYGLEMTGGKAYVNTSRLESNTRGNRIENADLHLAQSLVSDWDPTVSDCGITIQGTSANSVTVSGTTIANSLDTADKGIIVLPSDLDNTKARVTLLDTISVNNEADASLIEGEKDLFVDSSNNVKKYSDYDFVTDVLGNKYTLGSSSIALNSGKNMYIRVYDYDYDASASDYTQIVPLIKTMRDDLAGHDRILYGNVDIGVFEQPILYMDLNEFTQNFNYLDSEHSVGWLDDVKTAVENVAGASQGGRVVFTQACNGAVFLWYTHIDEEGVYNFDKYTHIAPPKIIYFDKDVSRETYSKALQAALNNDSGEHYIPASLFKVVNGHVIQISDGDDSNVYYDDCIQIQMDVRYTTVYSKDADDKYSVTVSGNRIDDNILFERQAIQVEKTTIVDGRFSTAENTKPIPLLNPGDQTQVGDEVYYYWMDVTLDAQGDTQLFYVSSAATMSTTLTIYGLTLANGYSDENNTLQATTQGNGGAIYLDGYSQSFGALLNLYSVSIENCLADADGGAIYSDDYSVIRVSTPELSGSLYGRNATRDDLTTENGMVQGNPTVAITSTGYICYAASMLLSSFSGNRAKNGGAFALNCIDQTILINGNAFEYGLFINGNDLAGNNYFLYVNEDPSDTEDGNRGRGTLYSGGIPDQNIYWTPTGSNADRKLLRESAGGTGAILQYSIQFVDNGDWAKTSGTDVYAGTELGGAIYCRDDVFISGASFVDNCAQYGGAIYVGLTANNSVKMMQLLNADFLANTATNGGALYVAAGDIRGKGNVVFARNVAGTRERTVAMTADGFKVYSTAYTSVEGNDGGAISVKNNTNYLASVNLENYGIIADRTIFGTMEEIYHIGEKDESTLTGNRNEDTTSEFDITKVWTVTKSGTTEETQIHVGARITEVEKSTNLTLNVNDSNTMNVRFVAERSLTTTYSNNAAGHNLQIEEQYVSSTTFSDYVIQTYYDFMWEGVTYSSGILVSEAYTCTQTPVNGKYVVTKTTTTSFQSGVPALLTTSSDTSPTQAEHACDITTITEDTYTTTKTTDYTFVLKKTAINDDTITASCTKYVVVHEARITPILNTTFEIPDSVSTTKQPLSYLFSENHAYDGGAIAAKNTTPAVSKLLLEYTRLTDNVAENNGGGALIAGTEFSMTTTNVHSNHAGNDGGGIYLAGTGGTEVGTFGASTLETISLINNEAERNGGGLFLAESTKLILQFGHAFYVGVFSTGTDGGNRAVNGAGIYISESAVVENHSLVRIANNVATGCGGGAYLAGTWKDASQMNSAESGIENTIYDNTAYKGGGTYIAQTGLFEIFSSGSVYGNNATYGGGTYFETAAQMILHADSVLDIHDNNTSITEINYGGGQYMESMAHYTMEVVVIEGRVHYGTINVRNNGSLTSTYGGGVYMASGLLYMPKLEHLDDDTVFHYQYNNALKGGAGYLAEGVELRIGDHVTINNNNAQEGGAFYFDKDSRITFESTTISAKTYHGGLALRNNNSSESILAACPNNYGGAIYLAAGATYDLSNSYNNDQHKWQGTYFENNGILSATGGTYGGAVYVAEGATLNVTGNALVTENIAWRGGGINLRGGTMNIAAGATLTVSVNEAVYGGGLCLGVGETSGISGTINFENATTSKIKLVDNNTSVTAHGRAPDLSYSESLAAKHTSEEVAALYNYGGAIYIDDGAALTINSAQNFDIGDNGCEVHTYGGLIGLDGTLTINASLTFSDQYAYCGGVIYDSGMLTLGDNVTLTLSNNQAVFGGATYHADDGTVSIGNGSKFVFTNNTAEYGGARYVEYGATLNLHAATADKTFYENNTAIYGGATYNAGTLNYNQSGSESSYYVYDEHNNLGNTADYGALIYNIGTLNMNYTKLLNDPNTIAPGTLCIGAGTVSLDHMIIAGNKTSSAIVVRNMHDNIELPQHQKGLVIIEDTFTQSLLNLSNSDLYDNYNCSVAVIETADAVIRNCNFYEDIGADMHESVYVGTLAGMNLHSDLVLAPSPEESSKGETTSVTIYDSKFYSHKEVAVVANSEDAELDVRNCRFYRNEVGIRVHEALTVNVANTVIRDWMTNLPGRAVMLTNGTVVLTNCTLACANDDVNSPVVITTGGEGTIALKNTISTNTVLSDKITSNVGDQSTKSFASYSLNTVTDATTHDRYLLTGNSLEAINQGKNADALYADGTAITEDLKKDTRVVNTVDLGAYEYTQDTVDLVTTPFTTLNYTGAADSCSVILGPVSVTNVGEMTANGFTITYYVKLADGTVLYTSTQEYAEQLKTNEAAATVNSFVIPFGTDEDLKAQITSGTEYFISWSVAPIEQTEKAPENNSAICTVPVVKLDKPVIRDIKLNADEDNKSITVTFNPPLNATDITGWLTAEGVVTQDRQVPANNPIMAFTGLDKAYINYKFDAYAGGTITEIDTRVTPDTTFYLDSIIVKPKYEMYLDVATSGHSEKLTAEWDSVNGTNKLLLVDEDVHNAYLVTINKDTEIPMQSFYYIADADPTVEINRTNIEPPIVTTLGEDLIYEDEYLCRDSHDLLGLNWAITPGVYKIGWIISMATDANPTNNMALCKEIVILPTVALGVSPDTAIVTLTDAGKLVTAGNAAQYAVEYSTDSTFATYTTTDYVDAAATDTTKTFNIEGLEDSQTYYFRVVARDASGTAVPTASLIVKETIATKNVDLVTDNNCTLKQTNVNVLEISGLKIANEGDKDCTRLNVKFTLTNNEDPTQTVTRTVTYNNLTAGQSLSTTLKNTLSLNNFDAGTYTLTWELISVNPDTEPVTGNNTGTTEVTLVKPSITIDSATIAGTTMDVTVTPNNPAGIDPSNAYVIEFSTNSDFSSPRNQTVNHDNINNFRISGLAPNTQYYYRTWGVTNGVYTLLSDVVSARTLGAAHDLATASNNDTNLSAHILVEGDTTPVTANNLRIQNVGSESMDGYTVYVYATTQSGTRLQLASTTCTTLETNGTNVLAETILDLSELVKNIEYTISYYIGNCNPADQNITNNTDALALGKLRIQSTQTNIVYAYGTVGWLDDVKYATEYAGKNNLNVVFDTTCAGKTFIWYDWDDPDTADTTKNRDLYPEIAAPYQIYAVNGSTFKLDTITMLNGSGSSTYNMIINETKIQNVTLDSQHACSMFVVSNKMTATIYRLTIENADRQTSTNGGGGICVSSASTLNLDGVSFVNCSAYRGGAIYGGLQAVINVTSNYGSSIFKNNSATMGGAIYTGNITKNALNVQGRVAQNLTYDADTDAVLYYAIQFVNNESSDLGGAIYIASRGKAATPDSIRGASFVNNTAGSNGNVSGGAIYAAAKSNVTLLNCDFASNSGECSGGAIASMGALTMSNVIFAGNFVENTAGLGGSNYGGALYIGQNATLTMGNSVTLSRAMYQNGKITKGNYAVEFIYNEAYNGGGVYFSNAGTCSLNNTRFANNEATNGGGFYAYKGAVSLEKLGTITYADNFAFGLGSDYWINGVVKTSNKLTNGTTTGLTGLEIPDVQGTLPVDQTLQSTSGTRKTVLTSWDTFNVALSGLNSEQKLEANTAYVVELTHNSKIYTLMTDSLQTTDGVTAEVVGETYAADGTLITTIMLAADESFVENGQDYLTVTFKPTEGNGNLAAGTEVFGLTLSEFVYDLTSDGSVDVRDLVKFAKNFGNSAEDSESGVEGDFNNDGIVDIFDLVLFAKNFGATQEFVAAYTPSDKVLESTASADVFGVDAVLKPMEALPAMESAAPESAAPEEFELQAEVETQPTAVSPVPSTSMVSELNLTLNSSSKIMTIPESEVATDSEAEAMALFFGEELEEAKNVDEEEELFDSTPVRSLESTTDAIFETEVNWDWLNIGRKKKLGI